VLGELGPGVRLGRGRGHGGGARRGLPSTTAMLGIIDVNVASKSMLAQRASGP